MSVICLCFELFVFATPSCFEKPPIMTGVFLLIGAFDEKLMGAVALKILLVSLSDASLADPPFIAFQSY